MPYFRGRVRPENLDHLIELSHARHAKIISGLPPATEPDFDAREFGWVGPVQNQGSCGCHDEQTEVLTERGWTRWDAYDWTTPIGTMQPETGYLEFQSPTGQHVYDYDGPLYYSEHRSVDFALTPNHRMYVRKWDESRRTLDDAFSFIDVQRLGWYAGLPHSTTGWVGAELKRIGIGGRTYDGDDLLALIAVIVSDGWAGGLSKGTRNQVGFCCFRPDRIEMIRALSARLGLHEQPQRPGYWLWSDGALSEWLRQNAYTSDAYGATTKRVPDLVKSANQRQIEMFLKYFGDQHIQSDQTRRFYSSSVRLIDDLQELLLRIGRRGTIEERTPRVVTIRGRVINSQGPDLTLTERRTDRLSIDRKDHLRTDHYKGHVYCATVPNGIIITRRNGHMLISGNSCWDFSGTGVVDIAYNKAGIGGGAKTFILSSQYTLSCGRNGGCSGDDNTTVLDWAKTTGLPLESDYGPYTGGGGLFSRCNFKQGMTLYKIHDWGFADSNGGQGVTPVQDIKNAIKAYGCVGCGIAANSGMESWGSNNPSFDHPFSGGGFGQHNINHDVILIGWHDDASIPGGGYWILRNSWGTGWGVGGYMAICYGANDVGTESVFAIPPINPNPIPTPGPTPGPSPTPGPTPPPPTPVVGTTLDQAVALVTQGIQKGTPYPLFTGKALPDIINAAAGALKSGWVNPSPVPGPTPFEPDLW